MTVLGDTGVTIKIGNRVGYESGDLAELRFILASLPSVLHTKSGLNSKSYEGTPIGDVLKDRDVGSGSKGWQSNCALGFAEKRMGWGRWKTVTVRDYVL